MPIDERDAVQYEKLFNCLPGAVIVIDVEGRIVSANEPSERMFGYSRDEMLGRPVETLIPGRFGALYDRERDADDHDPHILSTSDSPELHGERKGGSKFPIEVSLSSFEAGGSKLAIALVRDVTERKRAEEALRRSEERYRLLTEAVVDYAIFMVDPEGRIRTWNEGGRRMRGYQTSEIVGRDVSIFFTAEDVKARKPFEELREAREKGRFETEGWRVRKDGARFWSHVVVTALRDLAGQLIGFTTIARDITEQKRASEALLLEVSNRLIPQLNFEDLLGAISASLAQVKQYDYAGLALYDPSVRKLRVYTLPAPFHKKLIHEEILISLENSPAGWAFKARRPLVLNHVHEEGWPFEIPAQLVTQGVRSACRIPLISRDKVLGTLNLASTHENAFSEDDVNLLSAVVQQVALALSNTLSFRQLAEQKEKLALENQYLEGEIRSRFSIGEIAGESGALKQVLQQIETVAPTESTVLVLGETGTGKELIARAIHDLSQRSEKTLITVNCSALPAELLESELFGHEKGAFTGAAERKIGRFELAHHGTLFLDEVGDIPLALQPKLLRALQQKQFERLGSTQTVTVDVRLIAATNRDLEELVAEGRFRGDLYYRLNVFPIVAPPLRERAGDIPILARYFLEKYSRQMGKKIETIPAETLRALSRYSWPGNVRELEHFIERAVVLTSGSVLNAPPLGAKIQRKPEGALSDSLARAERDHILRVLRETNGIISGPRGAAARLGLKRTTLASKMQRLGISRTDV